MPKDLTALAATAAKPRATRYEMPDPATRGLRLVIQPSGVKSWAFRYRRPDGTTAKLTIGPYPSIDLRTARAKALQAAADVAADKDPGAAKRAVRVAARARRKPAADDTTAAAIELFAVRHGQAKNRESHWRETRRILELVLAPWAARRLTDIGKRDIHAILDAAMDRGAPTMANRELAALRRFFRWATERGLVSASPCAGIGAPAPTKARERVLSAPELAAVWRAAEGLGHPFGPIVKLLILTGQRRGEVAAMREADFDIGAARWIVPADIAKNGKAHMVHLAAPALAIVREALGRDKVGDFLFGATAAPSGWSKAKIRLDAAIGGAIGEPWVLHDIRRSVATHMAGQGTSVPVVERLLNHTSGVFRGVAGTYQRHEFLHEREEALTRWGDFVSGLTV